MSLVGSCDCPRDIGVTQGNELSWVPPWTGGFRVAKCNWSFWSLNPVFLTQIQIFTPPPFFLNPKAPRILQCLCGHETASWGGAGRPCWWTKCKGFWDIWIWFAPRYARLSAEQRKAWKRGFGVSFWTLNMINRSRCTGRKQPLFCGQCLAWRSRPRLELHSALPMGSFQSPPVPVPSDRLVFSALSGP